jgi:hypothetical protein
MVGKSSLIGLWKSRPSTDHNRGLDPVESPVNTTRLCRSFLRISTLQQQTRRRLIQGH